MTNQLRLERLYQSCSDVDVANPYYIEGAAQYVSGYGNCNSNIVLIGEAPGTEEEATGKPFQGRSGKLLRMTLAKYGLDDANMYVTNVVKFRPPHNRKPIVQEILLHMIVLLEELSIIEPQYVILIGGTALSVCPELITQTISKVRGKRFSDAINNRIYFPLYHPAYILRNMSMMPIFENDIVSIVDYINQHN